MEIVFDLSSFFEELLVALVLLLVLFYIIALILIIVPEIRKIVAKKKIEKSMLETMRSGLGVELTSEGVEFFGYKPLRGRKGVLYPRLGLKDGKVSVIDCHYKGSCKEYPAEEYFKLQRAQYEAALMEQIK